MLIYILYTVGCIGITNIFVNASITEPLRRLFSNILSILIGKEKSEELLSCMMCSGWWIGFIAAILLGNSISYVILMAGTVSLLSYAFARLDYLVDILENSNVQNEQPNIENKDISSEGDVNE